MAAKVVEQTWYICDPDKNKECKAEWCHRNGGPCRYTKHPEYSLFGTLPFKSKVVIPN